MCNRYHPARAEELMFYRNAFGIDEPPRGDVDDTLFRRDIGPFGQGAFIRLASDIAQLQQVVGQWGMIGWFAKSAVPPREPGRGGPILTNNACMETIAEKPTGFFDSVLEAARNVVKRFSITTASRARFLLLPSLATVAVAYVFIRRWLDQGIGFDELAANGIRRGGQLWSRAFGLLNAERRMTAHITATSSRHSIEPAPARDRRDRGVQPRRRRCPFRRPTVADQGSVAP